DDTSILWKEDLCIKNYQIGTAMRAKYTDADYIKKSIDSKVFCINPKREDKDTKDCLIKDNRETEVPGYGIAKMNILSTVSGASHVGVVVKDIVDHHITKIRVSEDYIGNFNMTKHMEVKMLKHVGAPSDDICWLPCPFEADLGHAEFYEGDC
ncbi:MAG: hypothetical protein IMF19_14060, partial [Proteobacteria bacterium]|nr:hypothetical protein [Pseudomonadota bacterium]